MIEHKQCSAHPVQQVLQRAAKLGAVPDAAELAEVDAAPEVVEAVRLSARALADHRETAGLRAVHEAARMADQQTDALVVGIPREYSTSVTRLAQGTRQ